MLASHSSGPPSRRTVIPVRALSLGVALALAALLLGGCGGGDAAEDCDDAAFADQTQTLAIAQGSIANAIAAEGSDQAIARDLRLGADALAEAFEAARPCDPELAELREIELASLARMDAAAEAFERGDEPPREELNRASADLTAVEERLLARKG